MNNIGFFFEQTNNLKMAQEYLEWVYKYQPDRTVVHLNLFDLYTKQNKKSGATKHGLLYKKLVKNKQKIPKRILKIK